MAAEGFPRGVRLRRTADYQVVQRTGRRTQTPNLVVRWRTTGDAARFGLSVSRKVGDAVTRNRVKRWLRESIRRQRGETTGVDVVFIARPSAAQAGYQALYHEVGEVLRRVAPDGGGPT